ncbi:putative ABC transport system permease protein [Kytococcus aerolatus]|uniref:Putative ABC transport system permease protein n=1 Tax=Kytococcus aerolatus TaxID=592308 RepID=A0A212U5M9_9MICO|nr:ABC transporter permease [Kytococcus aerolatus]SNC73565.1 putative ABC transport system permease protein [Kytococcus aerolatus]
MYVGVRDAWFARGRFAVMGLVVALLALLVVALSGLTGGLGDQSVSALRALPGERVVLAAPAPEEAPELGRSQLGAEQVAGHEREALGVATARVAATPGGSETTVAVLGVDPEGPLAPPALARSAEVGPRGVLRGVTGQDAHLHLNHLPAVWVPLEVWQELPAAGGAAATALVLPDPAGAAPPGTVALNRDESLEAVGSYASEQGSLRLMQGLLLAVSAVVTAAFLTVWTVQRTGELAVLRALGARPRTLVADVLSQGLLLLVLGGGLGALAATGLGVWVVRTGAVPWALGWGTTLVPWLLLVAAGLLGGALSVRRVLTLDPATALEASR